MWVWPHYVTKVLPNSASGGTPWVWSSAQYSYNYSVLCWAFKVGNYPFPPHDQPPLWITGFPTNLSGLALRNDPLIVVGTLLTLVGTFWG
jgi:hypothetical protein